MQAGSAAATVAWSVRPRRRRMVGVIVLAGALGTYPPLIHQLMDPSLGPRLAVSRCPASHEAGPEIAVLRGPFKPVTAIQDSVAKSPTTPQARDHAQL